MDSLLIYRACLQPTQERVHPARQHTSRNGRILYRPYTGLTGPRVRGAHIPGAKIPHMACGGVADSTGGEKERVMMLLLPHHADGDIAEPSYLERLKNFLMGSGVLKKLSGEGSAPPMSPEQRKLQDMQAAQKAEDEDRQRAQQGQKPKPRITPGFSK